MHAATHLATILVVEDHLEVVDLLERVLSAHGFAVHSVADGEAGLLAALEYEPDLLILDVGLPTRNGFDIVQELRRQGINTPMLMLTGRSNVADRIAGLEAGADDYLTKPFNTDELVARIRALLRRANGRLYASRLCVRDVALDLLSREVYRGERQIVLTQREFALLEYFMRNAGKPVSRASIAETVWQQTPIDLDETNIVDVYVAYLRKKLDAEGDEPMLRTVRGVGYLLDDGRPAARLAPPATR